MSVDIPDEAWVAAHSVAAPDLDEVVRAAAPHIARSAQLAVLREMKDELWRAKRIDVTGRRQIERKIAALEAGADQTATTERKG